MGSKKQFLENYVYQFPTRKALVFLNPTFFQNSKLSSVTVAETVGAPFSPAPSRSLDLDRKDEQIEDG